jgi:hypothetical protein
MGSYSIQIHNTTVQWSESIVQKKLDDLAKVKDTRTCWLKSDLELSQSIWGDHVLWTALVKNSLWSREWLYGINLDTSRSILVQLNNQIDQDKPLKKICIQAINTFNSIAPNHAIAIIPEITPLSMLQVKAINSIPSKTTKALMTHFDSCWNYSSKKFERVHFNESLCIEQLNKHNAQFKPNYNPEIEFGYIEKKDLPGKSKVFVRADLHGDLKSLIENIKTLQAEGLVDENYRCLPAVHLIFLGDYADRGKNTMQVLELLTSLRMENPNQVTLLRGNHENTDINQSYAGNDPHFKEFLKKDANLGLLEQVYSTMPLSVYICQNGSSGAREYIQFTHGAFEFHVDSSEFLNSEMAMAQYTISKKRELSTRILNIKMVPNKNYQKLIDGEKDKKLRMQYKQQHAAQRIRKLFEEERDSIQDPDITRYNWGDISSHPTESYLGSPGFRTWKISVADVKHYLRLSSYPNKVKMLFRGHEHLKQHHFVNKKIVVSTMPVGMESNYGSQFKNQLDTAYILTTDPRVRNWTKVAYLREPGKATKEVTQEYQIRSGEI